MILFFARAILVTALAIVVYLTVAANEDVRCPLDRFKMIGNTTDGKAIIVFDACLGMAYATPVAGLDLLLKPQAHKENI